MKKISAYLANNQDLGGNIEIVHLAGSDAIIINYLTISTYCQPILSVHSDEKWSDTFAMFCISKLILISSQFACVPL